MLRPARLLVPQDGGIDRQALETLPAKKTLAVADFGRDFDHANSVQARSWDDALMLWVEKDHATLADAKGTSAGLRSSGGSCSIVPK